MIERLKKIAFPASLSAILIMLMPLMVFAEEAEEYTSPVYSTGWAVLPPLIAICLALITKEVYSSLFIGVVAGGLLYAGGNFELTMTHVVSDGLIGSLSDSWNVGILVFLVILGTIVALMNKSGGSAAFGVWATKHIKTKTGAQLATILLGMLIFIDDYFNCLTVGSVMLPIAEQKGIHKTKLAYLIDATAAPICIIAPISSWAAAVSGFVEGQNGLALFIKSIPFNFYALLTIVMMFAIVLMKFDYGTMKTYAEQMIDSSTDQGIEDDSLVPDPDRKKDGKVKDLIIPIAVLILLCVIGMIYTGGFFSGESFVDAFANSDASVGLALGSIVALIFAVIYYLCRRVMTFKTAMNCLPEGFKAMVPPILILTLAWTLKAMTDSLGLAEWVAAGTEHMAGSMMAMLPAIIFLIACLLAFASGTSWGTFGILIPIVVSVFMTKDPQLMIVAISACMAGAVCGDHCSPISDTTIMASAGAKCNHVHHVSTQLPYAITVAAVSFVTYIVAGFTKSALISLPVGIILMIGTLYLLRYCLGGKKSKEAEA